MQKFFIFRYWKSITILLIIFTLSTASFRTVPAVAQFKQSDKLAHLLMYAGLAFVAMWEYSRDNLFKHRTKRFLLILFLFFFLFGGFIELIQEFYFKPRSAEWLDWLADLGGLIIGYLAGKLVFDSKGIFQKKG